MDAVRPLNYAPKLSAGQRIGRRLYRLIFAAAVVVAAVAWGPGLWRHTQQIYWQYQCLNFSLPANHVVWEMDRGKVTHAEVNVPQKHFEDHPNSPFSSGTIFLHEMRRPSGSRCLVSMVLLSPFTTGIGKFQIEYLQWDVSLWPKLNALNFFTVTTTTTMTPTTHYKFFAGQPDPNNASHFTFDFEVDNHRHTCDGWLNNDGQLIFSQRP